jgi:hypothetical protein
LDVRGVDPCNWKYQEDVKDEHSYRGDSAQCPKSW